MAPTPCTEDRMAALVQKLTRLLNSGTITRGRKAARQALPHVHEDESLRWASIHDIKAALGQAQKRMTVRRGSPVPSSW